MKTIVELMPQALPKEVIAAPPTSVAYLTPPTSQAYLKVAVPLKPKVAIAPKPKQIPTKVT